MFNSSKTNGHPIDTDAGQSARQINIIGPGTDIEGTVETDNNIRVGGAVHGEIKSGGTVVISEDGRVEGDVRAATVDVAGEIEGELHVTDQLIIRGSAVIKGDIHTGQLMVEEGGIFTGRCIMHDEGYDGMALAGEDQTVLESDRKGKDTEDVPAEKSAAAA